jgi:hypothetical protein
MIIELKGDLREKHTGTTIVSSDNPIPQVEDVKFNERMLYPESLHPSFPAIGNIEYSELENFEGIADIVFEGRFTHSISKDPIEFEGVKEEKSDPSAKVRDFLEESTSFVNREFFRSPEVNATFLKTVYNGINTALIRYKKLRGLNKNDIHLIYKGGNALRAVYAGFIRSLPIEISEEIETTFKDYFKKSDSDFGILIRPTLEKWDDIYIEVQKLVFLCLNKIRIIFMVNLDRFFDFYKLNSYVKKKLLLIQLDAMNKKPNVGKVGFPKRFENIRYMNLTVGMPINFDEITEDMIINDDKTKNDWNRYHSDPYRPDIFLNTGDSSDVDKKMRIYKVDKLHTPHYASLHNDKSMKTDVKLQKILYKDNPNNEMYISWNSDISFSSQAFEDIESRISKFCLIRMKTNFVYYYTDENNKYGLLNIPGELIDVSLSHKNSSDSFEFKFDTDEDITTFTYVDDTELQFKGYTYSYYLKDMNKMVLHETNLPWKIPKYEKRIKRLFFIYTMVFIRQMILMSNSDVVITLLRDILQLITDAKTNVKNTVIIVQKLKEVFNKIEQYKTDNDRSIEESDKKILDNISILFGLSSRKIRYFAADVIEEEVKDFLSKLMSYMTDLLNICAKLKTYIDNPVSSLKDQVQYNTTVTNIRSFSGGSKEEVLYKKYMKYKNKYENRKKLKTKVKK